MFQRITDYLLLLCTVAGEKQPKVCQVGLGDCFSLVFHIFNFLSNWSICGILLYNQCLLFIISICNQVYMQTKPEHVVVDIYEKWPERNFAKQTKKLYSFLMLCFKKGLQKCLFSKSVTFNFFLVFYPTNISNVRSYFPHFSESLLRFSEGVHYTS